MKSAWPYVISSAILYVISFLLPTFFCWSVFLFLIPLFYYNIQKPNTLTFIHGFVWGLAYWGILLFGLWQFLFLQARSFMMACVASIFFVCYLSVWSGVWFWGLARILRLCTLCSASRLRIKLRRTRQDERLNSVHPEQREFHAPPLMLSVFSLEKMYRSIRRWFNSPALRTVIILITTWLYFEFIWRGVISIFGSWHGMPISYPLLPLAQYPQFLQLVPTLGTSLLHFLLVLFAYCCATALAKPHLYTALSIAALSLLPFLVGWFTFKPTAPPAWLEAVVCVTAEKGGGKWITSRAIMQSLQRAHEQHPNANIFILPESALPYPLSDDDYCLSMWYDNALPDEATIILGAYHKANNQLYNSFYVLNNCRITHRYDKTSLLPFTEKLPDLWRPLLPLHNLFAPYWVEFSSGAHPRAPLQLTKELSFVPFICSELFFATCEPQHQELLMCIANDSWFPVYMQQLLFLNASLTALMWHNQIVYCSYAYQKYICQLGMPHSLQT